MCVRLGVERGSPEPCAQLSSHSLQDKPCSTFCLFGSVTVAKIASLGLNLVTRKMI